MKKWWILALLFIWACGDRALKTDRENAGLKGAVESVLDSTFKAEQKQGELTVRELIHVSGYQYNKKGFVEYSSYEVPRFEFIELYSFDSKGAPLQLWMKDGAMVDSSKCETILDKRGLIIEERWYFSNGELESKYVNSYDDKKRKIEAKAYTGDDILRSIRRNSYNDKGQLDTAFSYDSDGILKNYAVHAYNAGLRTSSKTFLLQGGQMMAVAELSTEYDSFDEAGNWTAKLETSYNFNTNERLSRITRRTLTYF